MTYAKNLFWKNWIVMILGLTVLIVPFLGFPARVDDWLFAILGLFISGTSFVIGRGLSYAGSDSNGRNGEFRTTIVSEIDKFSFTKKRDPVHSRYSSSHKSSNNNEIVEVTSEKIFESVQKTNDTNSADSLSGRQLE